MVTGALGAFPRASLSHLPTPLEEAPRLTDRLGGPAIQVKRDDLTSTGAGGNKVRKLEFLLGEALANGVDTVITFGADRWVARTRSACWATWWPPTS